MKRFYFKIVLPSILAILLFILTIFLVIIPRVRENIMNGKREMIKELTNSAWSILSKYELDERNGLLTREEAQKTAVSRIQYLRYGEESKDYFWITDLYPKMIMHPYRTDLNGKDLSNFSDPHGKKLFVEFVDTVKKSEHGYVDYMWQWKEDSLHIVPKLSYVKLFKPWGWVIGTGIYIEDVKKEINSLTKKMIWFSVTISIIIALLLLFISQQSIKTERKKNSAEKELQVSKEKYRALVEAATEGLIMMIDGRISFVNNVICKMTSFDSGELIDLPLIEIISDSNSIDILDLFSKKNIPEGQYEINLKIKNGGFIEVLITSTKAVFFSETVNIIIVKDITVERVASLSVLDYQKLLGTLDIGFFRARIDFKGRFIFANNTAIKLLGCDNFQELSKTYILELLADPYDRKSLRQILLDNGFVKNKILKIKKKNGILVTVSVTLVAFNNDDTNDLICDGIIEDITAAEKQKAECFEVISQLKSSNFLLEKPIDSFIVSGLVIDADSTISQCINLMKKQNSDAVLVTKNSDCVIGIITGNDIQNRVLSLNLQPDNPVYLIMSSPVVSASRNFTVGDILKIAERSNVKHILVKGDQAEIAGLIFLKDVYKQLQNSLNFLISEVETAPDIHILKMLYGKLMMLVKSLSDSDISIRYITKITSAFSDAVTQRVIELTTDELGKAPVSFAFIAMGSEGRQEETLFTDQDNAIIYSDGHDEEVNRKYFLKLGERVCDILNFIGYSYCKGNIMAKNPQWCKPYSAWEKYFTSWIQSPEPQNLLDASIFFDFRMVYGENEISENLRKKVNNLIENHTLFSYHLAYNTNTVKPPQIISAGVIADKTSEHLDLKNAVNFFIMVVRTYALHEKLSQTNTHNRINELMLREVFNKNTAEEILYAYNFLMKLRFRIQLVQAENNLPLSNLVNIKILSEIELMVLKRILSLIPVYQSKIASDFRISS